MLARIAAGQTELVAVPGLGGGVAALRWRGVDMLRPASEAALTAGDPTGLAEFPLAPFANRIANGRFRWQGAAVEITRPPKGGAHALHGHAWRSPWRTETIADQRLVMTLDAPASGAWPWGVRMQRTITVEENSATFAFALTALGPGPMPAGLGFHPYFPAGGALLRLAVARQIEATPDLLPLRFSETSVCAALAAGVPVPALALDHAFSGWDGRAQIQWPDRAVTIEADASCPFVHLYTPQGEDFFCVEPVSAMPDALNWQGGEPTGLRTLEPGQTLAAHMRLSFSASIAKP